MSQEDRARYLKAAHAMQTGVASVMDWDPSESSPKHLRTGVNSAMVESAALARLLMDKGLITSDEWDAKLAEVMEEEVARYTKDVNEHYGGGTNITLA